MKRIGALLIAVNAFVACQNPTVEPFDSVESSVTLNVDTSVRAELFVDPHSFSSEDSKVSHLDWDAEVDFKNEVIRATATWTLEKGHGSEVVFDVKALDIKHVSVDGKEAQWDLLGEEDPLLGTGLVVRDLAADSKTISITYSTTEGAEALQWFPAELTQGKRMPFLFTQSQAILARTWVPCQDRPGVRFTYDANVQVPTGMLALMSADNPQEKSADGRYSFHMPQPVPSYLLALGVGDLAFQSVGDRAGVYAEPEMVANAAFEFGGTEDMIKSAEDLYGPYYWGRYDMLVLPPSFPFGGMENPRLTFLTPTVIVGDRSLVSLIAHELAHSWSGNLVTNATWNDFWLNEGFTVYFEMRIMERVYGRDYADMLSALSYDDMQKELRAFMEEDPSMTTLKADLEGGNPDDGVNAIAYDKGYHFLKLCEQTVGREKWDAFLKGYFEKFRFKTMVTEQFLQELAKVLSPEQWDKVGVEQWVYGEGLPENCPFPASNRFVAVDQALELLIAADPQGEDVRTMAYLPQQTTMRWSTHEWLRYIRGAAAAELGPEHLMLMDKNYGFSTSRNPEIIAAWYSYVLKTPFEGHDPVAMRARVEEFLTTVGRRKFIVPMYEAMLKGSADRKAWAKDLYQEARPNYHPLTVQTVDALFAE
jgi:hypothetical protein